jgi:predicted HTH transcriptional regulator
MERVGGEEMHHWIINRLNPKIDYKIFEFEYEGKSIVMFENPASDKRPTKFFHQGYIRIGSYTRNLNDFPEKEKRIWNKVSNVIFEKEIVKENVSAEEVVKLLDVQSYFDLKKLPLPS